MILLDRDSQLIVHAPAKLNLFWEVIHRREDGFHEIATFMTAISLRDSLYFSATCDDQIRLACHWAGGREAYRRAGATGCRASRTWQDLPTGTDNLVVRAIELLRERTGTEVGVSVRIVKRIPSAAGLGGASADAAAALLAYNRLAKTGLAMAELATLAAELGSDVPFFLTGGAALCQGRGEQVSPQRIGGRLDFVVLRPAGGLATAEVYRNCRPPDASCSPQPLIEASRRGCPWAVAKQLHNRLEPAARQLHPQLGELRELFERSDCLGHQMSGSGSSYFGICRHARQARRLAKSLRARGFDAVWPVHSVQSHPRYWAGAGQR